MTNLPANTDKTAPLDPRLVYARLIDLMLTAGLPAPESIHVSADSVYVWMASEDRAGVDRWVARLGLSPATYDAGRAGAPSTYYGPPRTAVELLPGVDVRVICRINIQSAVALELSDEDQAAADRIADAADGDGPITGCACDDCEELRELEPAGAVA